MPNKQDIQTLKIRKPWRNRWLKIKSTIANFGQLKNLHVCVCVCSCTYHSLIQRLVQCSSSSKPKPRKTLANTKELQQASITLACPPREDVSSPLLDEYNLRFNHKTLALMSKGWNLNPSIQDAPKAPGNPSTFKTKERKYKDKDLRKRKRD
jgi:hypothetical protein